MDLRLRCAWLLFVFGLLLIWLCICFLVVFTVVCINVFGKVCFMYVTGCLVWLLIVLFIDCWYKDVYGV